MLFLSGEVSYGEGRWRIEEGERGEKEECEVVHDRIAMGDQYVSQRITRVARGNSIRKPLSADIEGIPVQA